MSEEQAPFRVHIYLTELRTLGCPFGEPLHYFASTTSTNDEAKAAAALGAPSGSTFVADHQTAGRGRFGRTWYAEANRQLLVSVLWRPRAGFAGAASTLTVGVALHRALAELVSPSANLAVKWPNDLEAGGGKLGGVLVESGSSSHGPHVVIGFGINVRAVAEADATVRATSLAELGVYVERETLLVALLRSLHTELAEFEHNGPRTAVEYLNRHHSLTGQLVGVDGLVGTVVEVAPSGGLVLLTNDGLREVTAGSVERRTRD